MIGLEDNSRIDIDWKTGSYSVRVNGAEIAKDGDTFCPLGQDRIAFYSKTGKELSAPLPSGWDAKTIAARALFADHSDPVPIAVKGGRVTVTVSAKRAVVVFRDGAKITIQP